MNGDSRRKAENQFQEIIQIKMEKNKAGSPNAPRLQTTLQSYSNKNSMVLAQKQT